MNKKQAIENKLKALLNKQEIIKASNMTPLQKLQATVKSEVRI